MIEHDHQLIGDVEAEQGFQSSEGDSELSFFTTRLVPGARSHSWRKAICRR